jgi:hypothetical protein
VLTERGRFCGGARADGEETLVRGRRSGLGGRRRGRGGAPWHRGGCSGVGGVGEQSERATTSEALTEEDDNGEISLPGFSSLHCGQALAGGGAR